MSPNLSDFRLVFVGPGKGQTAVGDYAQKFVDGVRPYFGEVVEHRTAGPGLDSLAEVLAHRRAVAELIAEGPPGRVLVHAELSTGVLPPFWAIAGLTGVPVTGTVHDPPQGLWFLARTRFIARSRLLTHGIHYPLRPLSRAIERVVHDDRTLFALTETGRRSIQQAFPRTHAIHMPHMVFDKPNIAPAQDRPKAVGFFGLVYRGKGFEQIARIREHLPSDILIRVAGRGTEALPRADGIEVLGGVEGRKEDDFFESVRAVVVPYGKRHFYAETYPSSVVVAHSLAYRTPVVATSYGSLAELDEEQGALTVSADAAEPDAVSIRLAQAVSGLLNDSERLTVLGNNSERTRQERSVACTSEAFAAEWSALVARQYQGA